MTPKPPQIEEFSFVLTVRDGSKRYGFCRRYIQPPPGVPLDQDWKPICYCIVGEV